jgi:hypothetical protein
MKYSGRTTSYSHKSDDWETKEPDGCEPFQQKIVFEVQWSKCPIEVKEEVKRLWSDNYLGNDYYYYNWNGGKEEANEYPIIAKYLEENNIQKCLIRWWW